MNTIRLYAWSCDFKSNTGEGVLCQDFCKTFSREKKVFIKLLSPEISAEIFKSNIKVKKKNKNNKSQTSSLHLSIFGSIIFMVSIFFWKKSHVFELFTIMEFCYFILVTSKNFIGAYYGWRSNSKK